MTYRCTGFAFGSCEAHKIIGCGGFSSSFPALTLSLRSSCERATREKFQAMLPSRITYRIVSAIVVVVSFTTASLCEVVWSCGNKSSAAPILDKCTAQLEDQAVDGELTRQGFALLVQNLSQEFVQGPFERLPLKYKSLFNAHACMDGRACIGDKATISISSEEERMMACSTLASQINESVQLTDAEGTCVQVSGNESMVGYNKGSQKPICTMNDLEMRTASMGK